MNLLEHKKGRALLVFALYLSEGAPIGFIWWAMPTILRNEGVKIEIITSLVAILVLPWVFKFLWAPLVDSLRSSRYGFKTWIFGSQILMGAALVPLIFISPVGHLGYWTFFLVLHAMAAATQDVSIDAMVINVVAEKERGILNGYMQAGMLTGRSVFGGGALWMVSQMGLPPVIILLIISVFITMILLAFVKEPTYIKVVESRVGNFITNLKESFNKKNTWLAILFALTGAAAFESAGALAGPFLIDINVSEESIGFFYAIPVVAAMLIGGFAGGKISDRFSREKSVGIFLSGFVFFVAIISLLMIFNKNTDPIIYFIGFGLMYLFVGAFTASSYALFMDLTNPKLGATQFSTYMAATNGCEAWAVWAAGRMTGLWDYPYAFLVMCGVSLLSLIFLYLMQEGKYFRK